MVTKWTEEANKDKNLSYRLEMASAMHFFVAKLLSIAVITYNCV